MSRTELDRMKRSVLPPTENFAREQKAAHLKKLSNERVKNWPNTLEALRHKKESYLKEKEEIEEKKRQEIDREEAELRRKTRLDSIERANNLLYEQTDKMKYLRSQELLSDVVYSRQFQLDEKKQREMKAKEEAALHHEVILKQVREGEAKEQAQRERLKKKMEEVTVSRKQQLDEVFARRSAELEEERQIGIELKREAELQLERDRVARLERQKQIDQSNIEMAKANEQLKVLRDEYRALELEEIARREAEVDVIENRKKVRKALEIRKFEKAQVTRQQIIDAATKALAAHSNKEQARMEKQASEQRAKEDLAIAQKAKKREDEWNDIVRSRAQQVERKKAARESERIEEEELIKLALEQAAVAEENERKKAQKARNAIVQVKKEQLAMAATKRKEKVEERLLDYEREKALHAEDGKDDAKFKEICKQEIARYKADGKPLLPLYRAMEHKAPELMAVTGFRI